MNKTVGRFEYDVWGSYPCWIEISDGDKTIKISHEDLADLKHVLKMVRRECKLKLGRDKGEV